MDGSAGPDRPVLSHLRARDVTRFSALRFKANRRTIVSASRDGRTLYLHDAFRHAPDDVVADLAAVLKSRFRRDRDALRRIRAWIATTPELSRARSRRPRRTRRGGARTGWTPRPCAGTPAQQAFLRQLYDTLNGERFSGRLPRALHLRFSARMSSRLGHVRTRPGRDGARMPLEIALNLDLMLAGNEAQLLDTMLHEMAHVEDALLHGGRLHAASWKRIARRVGCDPRACARDVVIRRSARGVRVTRVPALPAVRRPAA